MESLLIILLATVCTALPFHIGQRYGVVRLLSPMHLLSYFCLFGFLIKVAVYAVRPELAFYRSFVVNPWGDLLGALYLAVFVLLICAGYRLACGPSHTAASVVAARRVAGGLTRRGWLFAAAFGAAAATFLAILQARGAVTLDRDLLAGLNNAKQINVNADGVGATLAGIKTFFIVPKFAFVLLLAYGITTKSPAAKLQAGGLGLLLMVIALMSGDRFELVEMLVFALATYLILGGRLTWKAGMFGSVVVVALVLLSAYMTALRQNDAAIGAAFLQQLVGSTYFLDINAAIMVTDRVQPATLLLGESYAWWSFGWVPRAIWVDKPAIDLGVFFKRDVMGVYTGGAFNVTGPGEAFINFGWAGASVGFVLGWIYRKGEALLLSPNNTMRYGAFLLYPMLFYPFVQASLQSSFSAFIVGAVAQFILIATMIAVFVPRYTLITSPVFHQRSVPHVA